MMKRWMLWLAALLLAVVGVVGGGALWTRHQLRQTWTEIHRDLAPGRPAQVLDDPAFRTVPAPRHPVSLGRYEGQAGAQAPAASAVPVPEAAAAQPAQAQPPKVQAAPTVPASFLQRVATSHRLHLLIMGNDEASLHEGRADVLMVLTFDPVARQLTFLNIPRDTRVFLPGHGWVKINAGYDLGGPSLQTEMVERFLGIPMDKYLEISQDGFKGAIDAVGGVEVHPSFAFTVNGRYHFPLGAQRLNSTMALIYATMRKQDPEGDLGRNRRQQEVLRSLMHEFAHLSLPELGQLMTGLTHQLADNLRTDLTPAELLALRQHHDYLTSAQRTEQVRGTGGMLGRVWYYQVPDQERRRLNLLLRDP